MKIPTYSEISDEWFYLLLPQGQTTEIFEAADGLQDRRKSETILQQMENELPRTFNHILGIDRFEYSFKVLRRVDEVLTSETIASWIDLSDPDDPNNFFKLTLSEMAVYFGNLLLRDFGGMWQCARFPNFFQSSVVIGDIEFYVFDTIMKRCSADHKRETLVSRWSTFQQLIASSSSVSATVS